MSRTRNTPYTPIYWHEPRTPHTNIEREVQNPIEQLTSTRTTHRTTYRRKTGGGTKDINTYNVHEYSTRIAYRSTYQTINLIKVHI